MYSRKYTSMLVLLATLAAIEFLPIPALAGSLSPDPLLSIIRTIRLTVSTGDLGYDPIPDLDLHSLRDGMRKRCEEALRSAQLDISSSADAFLSVTIDHAWAGDQRHMVALLTTLTLGFPAAPAATIDEAAEGRKRTLTVWRDQRLELVRARDAHVAILRSLELALEDLVAERLSHSSADADVDSSNSLP
jgi:hypothetical protein